MRTTCARPPRRRPTGSRGARGPRRCAGARGARWRAHHWPELVTRRESSMGVKMLGARVKRIEDPRLLRGEAAYVDDLHQPGLLHMAILRSPHAHARLGAIELTRARALPGVVAESRAIAEDALDLIQVEYEVLEPVPSVEAALAGAAPVLHAGVPGNRYAEWSIGVGDVDAAFGEADVVVRERLAMQRYTGVPMETRGLLASHDRLTGELVVWASTQWPHTARALTAALLGIPEQQVRVILPEIGGGFGVKGEFYPE